MFRIFGPPGTGKTTTLLNMVDEALESGVHPHKIAFLAFTRKAANEARDRAAARFNLDPKKDLSYFRTLHSLAMSLSNIRSEQVMQEEHYRELSETIGVEVYSSTPVGAFEEDITAITSNKNPILNVINLARLRKVDLRDQYNESNLYESWNVVNYVATSLEAYKGNMGLYDFTDMLDEFIRSAHMTCPHFDLCFIDEAQDLSPLQWDLAHILDENSTRTYCAGDDDQAIYRWAGADVDHFINLPGGSETLSQSYRVPRRVHAVAQTVASRINRRFPKRYEPKPEEGHVQTVAGIEYLDMSSGEWLILSQAGYMLQDAAAWLKSGGYLFNYRGSRSIGKKLSDAVNGWETLRRGHSIPVVLARQVYAFMSAGTRIKRGFKKLTGLEDDDVVSMSALMENHGLLADQSMIWSEALDKIPETDRAYVTALLRRGEKFNAEPRISLSTIHGSKGGEADNVVLYTSLTKAADDDMQRNPDDMHRVFYVGITRTKDTLVLVEPEDAARSYYI